MSILAAATLLRAALRVRAASFLPLVAFGGATHALHAPAPSSRGVCASGSSARAASSRVVVVGAPCGVAGNVLLRGASGFARRHLAAALAPRAPARGSRGFTRATADERSSDGEKARRLPPPFSRLSHTTVP
jgi:hypothetical protein